MTVENLLDDEPDLPPLNALKAFDAAGRHLTFRAAAEALGVSQGAVAQQVRSLEARLGVRLFERHARGLALTEAGRAYHEEVSAAFAMLGAATARLAPAPNRVTISVPPTFAAKWLIPQLSGLATQHPEIDLRVLATERVLSFRSDGIDLAVRQAAPPFGASLEARLLFPEELIAVAHPDLLADLGAVPGASGLGALTLLHDAHNLWPEFFRTVLGAGMPGGGRGLGVSLTSLGIDAALAGQGVALASRFLVARELEAGRLVQVVPGHLGSGRGYFLLVERRARARAAVDAVVRWLLARGAGAAVEGG